MHILALSPRTTGNVSGL